ncbi:hypothetical protein T265_09523 [Opisthorchis viverrini]|uniref:Uncharacterized protein n=1 Tax=Opisthorchis viverrini TaxID=6198 RepID=A0A074Z9U9_OPIVI|nr:hypothetical protein T265_09523 [Opisthorchis viverrini]KER22352.1 hypothetical protein T265_09523 [Opisthorchis viverrini]
MNTYLRPTMEYAIQAWSPWLQKDTQLLERIYHRATKLVIGLRNVPYSERLRKLDLFDLTYRRIRGDLILMFKIINTPNHPLKHLFTVNLARQTRRNPLAVDIPCSRINCRRYFFSVRVSLTWNKLPTSVVDCERLPVTAANHIKNHMCSRKSDRHTANPGLDSRLIAWCARPNQKSQVNVRASYSVDHCRVQAVKSDTKNTTHPFKGE